MNTETAVSTQLRVKIIGVGGMGAQVLEHVARTELGQLPLSVVHTHARVLQQSGIGHRILVGLDRTRGLGTGGDAELGRVMAENEAATLREVVQEADLVFLVGGMGGGTGSGLAPVLARQARQAGALVVALVTMPFEFEGPRRQKQAIVGVQMLRAEADAVICVPNQKSAQLLEPTRTVIDVFAHTNDLLAEALLGIYQMLTRPGLINVDFAYLCSVVKGRHVESALAAARATGENRARDVVEKILNSPLLDHGRTLEEADQVLASVVASENLTMAEVNKVMELLGRHVEPSQLIVGTALDRTRPDFISLTVLACRNGKPSVIEAASEPARREFETSNFLKEEVTPRPPTRFLAPAPESTPENTRQLLETQPGGRKRKGAWKQELLALEIVSRGRFEKSEPTIHRGADLDVPTYYRRGIPLN